MDRKSDLSVADLKPVALGEYQSSQYHVATPASGRFQNTRWHCRISDVQAIGLNWDHWQQGEKLMPGTHRDISSPWSIEHCARNFVIPETFGTIVHIAQCLSFGDTPWRNSKNRGSLISLGAFYDETCLGPCRWLRDRYIGLSDLGCKCHRTNGATCSRADGLPGRSVTCDGRDFALS